LEETVKQSTGDVILKAIGQTVLVMFTIAAISLLMAFPTKWMTNYVFSDSFRLAVFGVAKIGFWRAFFFGFLIASLFKTTVKK
jgi:hypothetical protein